jgi:hypothetical protein
MKTSKPKLFTSEFVSLCLVLLSMIVGVVTILIYRDRLPLWVIIGLGFWYPICLAIKIVYRKTFGSGDSL